MRVKGWVTKCFAIMVILAVFMTLAGPAMAKGSRRVLIGFKANSVHKNAEQRGKFVKDRGGKVHHSFTLISAVSAEMPEQAVAKMRGHSEIAYVEDDIVMHAIGQSTPWGISRVNAPTAWGSGVRGAGVDVAILDTGIDYDHPDLDGNIAGGVCFEGVWNDGSTDSTHWNDGHGHGTHCAGIVAAEDNTTGVVGVAPDANLWAVKVLSNNGAGFISDIVQGLEWCVNNGIEVASMSLGGGHSQSLENACNAVYAAGVLVIAAAGNSNGGAVIYPAAYGSVIAVSATNSSDGLANFSSVGPQIELAAPGASIYSTYKGGGYTTISGTSMACPHVSGVAALVFASGSSNAAGVRQRMNDTARNIGLSSNQQGNGLVDAGNAVDGIALPSLPVADFTGSPISGEVSLTVGFTDSSSGNITGWSWDFGDGGTSNQRHPSHAYNSNGNYTVKLTVTNLAGADIRTRIDYVTVTSPSPPSADFSSSPNDETPLTIDFVDESTGGIDSWLWSFGDSATSTQPNPSHTYGSAGTYSVSLTITGPGGSDTYTDSVSVVEAPQAPTADFTCSSTSGDAPLTVFFSDLSIGNIASWSWSFGDGGISSLQNPSHTYEDAGIYTVSLTVDGAGGLDTRTKTNYITVTPVEQLSLNVADIRLTARYRGAKKWRVTATVLIVDSNGKPVSGATVSGAWSGGYVRSVSGLTGTNGTVSFNTSWLRNRTSVTFTVTGASRSGYESAADTGTSVMITYGNSKHF